jgi:hypothetical protein
MAFTAGLLERCRDDGIAWTALNDAGGGGDYVSATYIAAATASDGRIRLHIAEFATLMLAVRSLFFNSVAAVTEVGR